MASAVAGYVLDHYRHKSFNILPTAHKDHHQFCRHLKIVKDWKKSCHKDKSSDRRESDDAEELGSLKMGRWKVLSNERNLIMIHLSVDLRRQTQKCERGEEASWVFQMRQYLWWQYEHQQWWWWWLPTRENVTGRKCIERPPSRVISGLHLVTVIMIEGDDDYYNTTMTIIMTIIMMMTLLAPGARSGSQYLQRSREDREAPEHRHRRHHQHSPCQPAYFWTCLNFV